VYCAEKIERMGDLAAHIADTARFTHPEHAVPAEFEGTFTELDETVTRIGVILLWTQNVA
jgi:phosphate transport system protein